MFLVVTKSMHSRTGPVALSLNRDIVVHTASMVEASLHHGITQIISNQPSMAQKLDYHWKRELQGTIHSFGGTEDRIIWIKQKKTPQVYKENPSSDAVNKAALDIELIDNVLFEKAEKLRTARNHIHFIGESKQVSYPSNQALNTFFEDTKSIFNAIKIKLNEIEENA